MTQPSTSRRSDDLPWAFRYPDPTRHEVICHNDFAPYNFVYHSGIPAAVIDFDLAGPGPRLRDVAYAAYWMVPLSFNSADQKPFAEADATNGSRRFRLFCETYGVPITPALFEMIAEVLNHMGSKEAARRMVGDEKAEYLEREGHLAHWQREAAAFQAHRAQLEANVQEPRYQQ
ncbi:MAG: aminoglycoside phosphotransferase family protein [Caldilineaceae bacterium]|nr:aminoglycoside phosphotransferase family protein [Caldilineaceae bacterium]